MDPFDDELRQALKRRDPPDGFSQKTLARIRESEARPRVNASPWRWRTALLAAAVVSITIGLSVYREHLRRIEGERAKQEVLFALRVTGTKLRSVQERVSQVQQRTIEVPMDRN